MNSLLLKNYSVLLISFFLAGNAIAQRAQRKGCQEDDIFYEHGQTVLSNDPCDSCICRNGKIECETESCCPPPEIPGCVGIYYSNECCPDYSQCREGCKVDGVIYSEGDDIPQADPCTFCNCFDNKIVCAVIDCAPPPEGCEPIFVEDQCCPDYDCDVGCEVDGQKYKNGEDIPSDDPCRICSCFDNQISCAIIDCPRPIENCPPTFVEGECCPRFDCQEGCKVNGQTYTDGDSVPDDDPCKYCICDGNRVICAVEDCAFPTGCKPIFVEGQCCPDFDCDIGCEVDGQNYKNGEDIPGDDPCTFCSCNDNEVLCASIACASPPENCKPIYTEDQCCPDFDCNGECNVNGVIYQNGEVIPDNDPCKFCNCFNSEQLCALQACEAPPPGCEIIPVEGQCCPDFDCSLDCVYEGETIPNGENIPNNDPCRRCTCSNGDIICALVACAGPPNENCEAIYSEGQCCPDYDCPNSCEVDGVIYANGQAIPSDDTCIKCLCSEGFIACSKSICLGPPIGQNCEPVIVEGKCCPTYECGSDCVIDGVTYKDGESIPSDNPCDICICSQNEEICAVFDCPPIPPNCIPVYDDDKCCPEMKCEEGCSIGGNFYPSGADVPSSDSCEYCTCEGDTVQCVYQDCPAPPENCEGVSIPGQCCRDYSNCGCEFRGDFYESGQTIPTKDACEFCRCEGNQVQCAYKLCVAPPPGCNVQPLPGQCCPDISQCEPDCSLVLCEAPPYPACEGVKRPGQCCLDYSGCRKCPNMVDCSLVECAGPPAEFPHCEGILRECSCCSDYTKCS